MSDQIDLVQAENVDNALMRERNEELARLGKDLEGVNELAQIAGDLLGEQQEIFDEAENNVTQAERDVEKAIDELSTAKDLSCSVRWKMCIIASILIVVLTVIIILIIYFTGGFNGSDDGNN
eukprot:TRINITY_DN6458_c0_g1_i1.p1 TRINITY_DN6458_c0_g1~~TRINITY_DN6458_c0_g1_i1.p1  ORF type:complete len:131 (+),score=29.77 TRINITY_DN6458_c0_g1_i1:29-394(+)